MDFEVAVSRLLALHGEPAPAGFLQPLRRAACRRQQDIGIGLLAVVPIGKQDIEMRVGTKEADRYVARAVLLFEVK